MVWLLHVAPWDGDANGVRDILWSTSGWIGDAGSPWPSTPWRRRVLVPLERVARLFQDRVGAGGGAYEAGRVLLDNRDGALDPLLGLEWQGAPIEIRWAPGRDPAWADTAVAFVGWVRQLVPGPDMALDLDDVDTLLEEPLQPVTYPGTGGTGGSAALAGRRIPWAGGRVVQVLPDALDEAGRLWRWSVGPVDAIEALSDGGDLYEAPGPDYPAGTDLAATSLPDGVDYITCHADGALCLRARPQHGLRLTGRGQTFGTLGWRGDAAGLIEGVLTTRLDLAGAGAGIDTAALAALAAAAPHVLGDHVAAGAGDTVGTAIARWAASIEASHGFGPDRLFRAALWDGPATVPDAALWLPAHLVEPQPDEARRVKRWRVGHGRRWAPLAEGEIAGSVTPQAARDALMQPQEWLEEAPAMPAHLRRVAEEVELSTLLPDATAAAWLLGRLQALRAVGRRAWRVPLDRLPAGLAPGATVRLTCPGHGLDAGRNLALVEKEYEPDDDVPVGLLWG